MSCCVPNCSAARKRDPELAYHEFPTDFEQCLKWVEAVGIPDLDPYNNNVRVCSRHFTEKDYSQTCKIRVLDRKAVPSVFEDYFIDERKLQEKRKRQKFRRLQRLWGVNVLDDDADSSEETSADEESSGKRRKRSKRQPNVPLTDTVASIARRSRMKHCTCCAKCLGPACLPQRMLRSNTVMPDSPPSEDIPEPSPSEREQSQETEISEQDIELYHTILNDICRHAKLNVPEAKNLLDQIKKYQTSHPFAAVH